MSKLYTLKEILKQDGKKFEVILNAENPAKQRILESRVIVESGRLFWENTKQAVFIIEDLINASYCKPKKEKVRFQEVLSCKEKCRVEHELINKAIQNLLTNDVRLINLVNIYEKKEFLYFDNLMYLLSNILNQDMLKEVIKSGNWYLEN